MFNTINLEVTAPTTLLQDQPRLKKLLDYIIIESKYKAGWFEDQVLNGIPVSPRGANDKEKHQRMQ